MRTCLYPWNRIGLIQAKKALLKRPFSSSGDFSLTTIEDAERLPKFSNSKSAECMLHRRNTGRGISAYLAADAGIVKRITSQSTDASRYSVIGPEGL